MVSGAEKSGRVHRTLHLDVQRCSDGLVLGITGELDVAGCDAMRLVFDSLAQERLPRVVVDLTDLSFTDSTGLGVLVRAHKQAVGAGTIFTVVSPPGRIRNLFTLTHLADTLNVVDTIEQAWTVVEHADHGPAGNDLSDPGETT